MRVKNAVNCNVYKMQDAFSLCLLIESTSLIEMKSVTEVASDVSKKKRRREKKQIKLEARRGVEMCINVFAKRLG